MGGLRVILAGLGAALAFGFGAPAAGATASPTVPKLKWADCGDGLQCATAKVPRDYDRPHGQTITLAVARIPATGPGQRIGSLFVNFGGPGAPAVELVKAFGKGLFASLLDRFDVVGIDPRGVGESTPSIDCAVNQETDGVYSQPFPTPFNLDADALVALRKRYIRRCRDLNPGILPYVTTANTARDMDLIRAAVGDKALTYLGFSYGTFLGATYESLFSGHVRALVLDGALDAEEYINRPLESLREQSGGFERALERFFQACAAQHDVCKFGGVDPAAAFDALAARLDASPVAGPPDDPRAVDGDDLRSAALIATYARQFWPDLADALARTRTGDFSGVRLLADLSYGRNPDGTYDPGLDRYFTFSAVEQRYPGDVQTFLDAGRHSWGVFDHFWWNSGYAELPWGLYPVAPRSAFYGPFRAPAGTLPTLVVGTTYDPATPYRGAIRLVAQLGNARLLTMRGDGHTAYGGNSPCIDAAVDAYLEDGVVPAVGATCDQDVPFTPPPAAASRQGGVPHNIRPHMKPLGVGH